MPVSASGYPGLQGASLGNRGAVLLLLLPVLKLLQTEASVLRLL